METRPVALGASRVDGVEYSLPALELEFAVTRRMVDCTPAAEDGSAPLVPKFEVTAEPKQDLVAAETFVMDYSKLSKAWKTSKLTVDWHDNRMLKTVNATATDKSVDIALDALKMGISVAKLAGGIPVAGGLTGAGIAACPVEVTTRKTQVTERKTAQEELAKQTAIITAFSARDAAKLSDKDKEALGDAVKAAETQTNAIAKVEKKLAELDKVLALTETVRWRPPSVAGTTLAQAHTFEFPIPTAPTTLEEQARVKWIKRLFGIDNVSAIGVADPGCENDVDTHGEPKQFRCRLQQALALQLRLDPESLNASADQLAQTEKALGLGPRKSASTKPARDHVAGVVTRIPVRARLLACSGAGPCQRSSSTKLVDQLIAVPQFGHYLVLPFSNGIGEDNALIASFAENGTPTSVTFEDKQAAGAVIAKGASQGADAALAFAREVRAAEKAKDKEAQAAPLKALESQAKLLEQQTKIAEYQALLDPANAELAAQKAWLNSQLAILTTRKQSAQLEIDIAQLEARALTDPSDYAIKTELERLQSQQSVLEARAAIAAQCTKTPTLPGCAS